MTKRILAAAAAVAISACLAQAQEVKVGLVAPFTGIGAELGQQVDRGIELYLKLNADKLKPYTVKLIKRDDKNPSGADSKVAVQELLTQENVEALIGWVYSPNAFASAPVVTVFPAASSIVAVNVTLAPSSDVLAELVSVVVVGAMTTLAA